MEVAPLDLLVRISLAEQYMITRQFDLAVKECNEVVKAHPEFMRSYWDLAWNYEYLGDYDRAIAARQIGMQLEKDSRDRSIVELDRVYRNGGINAVRRWDIENLLKRPSFPAFIMASLYARLGEQDKAIAYLQNAFENREGLMMKLNVEPWFDAIRPDPRFQELVHRVGLPR